MIQYISLPEMNMILFILKYMLGKPKAKMGKSPQSGQVLRSAAAKCE